MEAPRIIHVFNKSSQYAIFLAKSDTNSLKKHHFPSDVSRYLPLIAVSSDNSANFGRYVGTMPALWQYANRFK